MNRIDVINEARLAINEQLDGWNFSIDGTKFIAKWNYLTIDVFSSSSFDSGFYKYYSTCFVLPSEIDKIEPLKLTESESETELLIQKSLESYLKEPIEDSEGE